MTPDPSEPRDSVREALEWYRDEAQACAKNSHSGSHSAPEALLASVTVLAFDGGRRADAALALLSRATEVPRFESTGKTSGPNLHEESSGNLTVQEGGAEPRDGVLEPHGGNLYRPHAMMSAYATFWRCAHGKTGLAEGEPDCIECAKADPAAFVRWHNLLSAPVAGSLQTTDKISGTPNSLGNLTERSAGGDGHPNDSSTEYRVVPLVQELRIEAALVPHRRGQLYALAADEIDRLRAASAPVDHRAWVLTTLNSQGLVRTQLVWGLGNQFPMHNHLIPDGHTFKSLSVLDVSRLPDESSTGAHK